MFYIKGCSYDLKLVNIFMTLLWLNTPVGWPQLIPNDKFRVGIILVLLTILVIPIS
jgi:hypothetical protein